MMRKTRSLVGKVRRQSINAQTSEAFLFIRDRIRRVLEEHATSPQRSFILRPTEADALLTTLRHSKQWQIPRQPTRIRLPVGLVPPLSPGKRSPLARMQITGHFWTKAPIKSLSTEKMSL